MRYDSASRRSFLLTFKTVAKRCSFSGTRFSDQKPLSQIQGSTILPLQHLFIPHSFGGFGLRQADKVAPLEGGQDWYRYLSEYFCHGRADWRGHSLQGGVTSINTVQDEYALAGLMDYLVNQVAVMNAYAALCPVAEEIEEARVESTLAQLHEVRAATKSFKDDLQLAVGNPDEGSLVE